MAYVNVAEWKTEQVCEWLKGLDNSVLPYVHSFTNHCVNGQQLLSLRPEDLEHFGVLKLGHQEIILEAVEYLRNFHYELDRENLQLLALRLSCQAHSLRNELSRQTDSKPVTTQTLSDVASVIMAVKPLVRWLDRPPFSGQLEYNDKKAELMKLALEMATCAQRDRFAEKPIQEIRTICGQLAKLADYIIQDITDPMILQPASLDLATLKKKTGDDLGFYILPSFHGAHQIAEIKFGSTAHQCGKMEEGDEIVQVNYQTVVGWERKNLLELFRESPAEVLLTLKRRPRHTKVYGQIYIKPYRLPSNKKTSYTTRWQHNLPSPRPELLTIPDFTMPLPRPKIPSPEPASILDTVNILDTMIIDSSDSDSEAEPPLSIRLYSTKPRNSVQRRATITGASPTTKHGIDIEQFWKELKQEHNTTSQLRDKAASCAHGLDNVPSNIRPQTCISIEQSKRKKRNDGQTDDKKVQFQDRSVKHNVPRVDNTLSVTHEKKDECKTTVQNHDEQLTTGSINNPSQISQPSPNVTTNNNNLSDTSVPLDECNNFIRNKHITNKSKLSNKERSICKERGRLDKSHSTPAYDSMDADDIENRRQKLFCTVETPANNVSSVWTKTDVQVTSTKFEDQQKSRGTGDQKQSNQINFDSSNTARKNNIDKHIAQTNNDETQFERSDSLKTSACKISNASQKISIENNQSNNDCINSDVNKYEKKNMTNNNLNLEMENMSKVHNAQNFINNSNSNHKFNEDRLELMNSYVQTSEANNPNPNKFGKILQTFSCSQTERAKLTERKSNVSMKERSQAQGQVRSNNDLNSTVDDMQNITRNIPQIVVNSYQKIQNDHTKTDESTNQGNTTHSCKCMELTRTESKKLETKPHLIPPDPPPRKYHTKLTVDSVLGNTSNILEDQEKYTSEKPNAIKDLKGTEYYTETYIKSNLDYQERPSYFDGCNSLTEKLEFIDDANSLCNERRPSLNLDSSYLEYNDKQTKENKSICDKYESTAEKPIYSNSTMEYHSTESYSQNMDSPDGSCSSKQSLEHKSKVSEKEKSFEKGMVNKAMMVARSIGLHGSLGKSSSNSPRSNRKRSILFARKRNISVKDIGTGDLEGWLTYRTRGAGGAWAKAWFILKCSSLYRFKTQNSMKADCLIALTGFTVSRAAEVKSRKYAFKVYHTGTVFYFAADTEDSLALWVDAINKATLGADGHSRSSALFSETDESDSEQKNSSTYKDHEISGASLDRKYLKFLGTKNHNVPVPTAQFRSYRRVIPTSTPNKKQESVPNSPDLQMTIAGSTFYGLCASHSATDMTNSIQDMGDYRRTTDRCFSNRNRRLEDLQGFITLEEFMLSQQEEQRQMTRTRPVSPRITPLTSDHVHVQHRNFYDNETINEQSRPDIVGGFNNDVHARSRNNDEMANNTNTYGYSRNMDNFNTPRRCSGDSERNEHKGDSSKHSIHKKSNEFCYVNKKKSVDGSNSQQMKSCNLPHCKSLAFEQKQLNSLSYSKSDIAERSERQSTVSCEYNTNIYTNQAQSISNHDVSRPYDYYLPKNINNLAEDMKSISRLVRNDGTSGSSNDLTFHASCEALQRTKKNASVNRKGSFNLTGRRDHVPSDKNWLDSLRRVDKKDINYEKTRLKNVAQYQPPPIPTSPFEQDGMTAAFEMHLDKSEQVQKTNRLKNLFGNKGQQKPSTLDLPKETQKTLLGSPRLHRALFREKCYNQTRLPSRSNSQSPGDSGISQSVSSFSANSPQTLSQSFSSVNSVSDWSPDTPSPCAPNLTSKSGATHPFCQKGHTSTGRNSLAPPTLPYIPPPTSPPPDYPGLEYPPVFEPGTYSLLDASLLRNRNKSNRNTH
ncbi:connector enhancer of ksr isoform X2 [Xylocopa sonorina]|uniref:connector enhancer of ksr isoform X2 n=1 Tax=Xylocopa sonorina TaxID=1818115 RepID=UPI00403AEDE5